MSHTAQDLKGGPSEWWKGIDNLRNKVAQTFLTYILLALCSFEGFFTTLCFENYLGCIS